MGFLDSFFNPQKGYQKGQEQLDKYYGQAQGYLNPIMQHGEQSFQPTFEAMQKLLNPAALQSEWSKSYETSPYAKQLMGQAQTQGLDAASSMGLMGSSPALSVIQQGTTGIMNADRQQYMNDLMQKYMAGTGIGQNFYGIGANAASGAANNAMNMGQQSAGMAYGAQNAPGNLLGGILSTGAGLLGGYLNGKWNTGGK